MIVIHLKMIIVKFQVLKLKSFLSQKNLPNKIPLTKSIEGHLPEPPPQPDSSHIYLEPEDIHPLKDTEVYT